MTASSARCVPIPWDIFPQISMRLSSDSANDETTNSLECCAIAYLSGPDLALVLEQAAGKAPPRELNEYLIRFLRGEVKRKRGRKPRNLAAADFNCADARDTFDVKLAELEEEDRRTRAQAPEARPRICSVSLRVAGRTHRLRGFFTRHVRLASPGIGATRKRPPHHQKPESRRAR